MILILFTLLSLSQAQSEKISDFPFAETSASPTRENESCMIGSPLLTNYVDEFYKTNLDSSDSFLQKYREFLFVKKIKTTLKAALRLNPFSDSIPMLTTISSSPSSLRPNPKEYIKKSDVECALKRVPVISGNRKICATSDSDLLEPKNSEFYTQETPCITKSIASYLQWGLNEALGCFAPQLTPFERDIILKKIILESSFGFFFQGQNGSGITQIVPKDIREILKRGYSGHSFLKKYLSQNKEICGSFTALFKKDFLVNSNRQIPQCQFISIGDGIGRAYIAGIGLYVYYRSYDRFSAEYMLNYLGIPRSKESSYLQMRSILALGMYNKGPGTVWNSIKFYFEKDELAKIYRKNPSLAVQSFKAKLNQTSFYLYVTELERSFKNTFKTNGSCRFKSDPQPLAKTSSL